MARSRVPNASLSGLTVTENIHGEREVQTVYRGQQIKQTVPCGAGCVALFFDPATRNVKAVQIPDVDPSWELWEVIR